MRNRPKITDANVFFLIFVALFLFYQIAIGFIAAIFSINYGAEYLQNFASDNICSASH